MIWSIFSYHNGVKVENSYRMKNGKSTKIIVPSNLQDVTSLITSLTEVAKTPTPVDTDSTDNQN